MHIIADLQLHSKYARAVSPQMVFPQMTAWGRRKGIGILATGDWTHPLWMREIQLHLEELGNGLLGLKGATPGDPQYLLATEVSCIYTQGGKGRRVHTLIWVPTLTSAIAINKEMTRQGCNLLSDGRPIIGLTSIQVAELVLTIEPHALIIPAHAWTPWFSVYGAMSGFDSLEDAYGPYAKHIYAVETGLSSNPSMNWRIKELDHRAIVSFSDAHSGPKLGREATVFEIPDGKLSYEAIYAAIRSGSDARRDENFFDPLLARTSIAQPSIAHKGFSVSDDSRDTLGKRSAKILSPLASIPDVSHIAYTIEFYPEEGKYHYTGHRTCKIRLSPQEVVAKGTTCPVCGKPLTQGVMARVEELAGRSEADLELSDISYELSDGKTKVKMTGSKKFPKRPPFVMLVPLQEIIAESIGSPVASVKVQPLYTKLTDSLGGEFSVLLSASHGDIAAIAGERVATGVDKVRMGDLVIDPGYDGVFGVVKLWREGEEKPLVDPGKEQLTIF